MNLTVFPLTTSEVQLSVDAVPPLLLRLLNFNASSSSDQYRKFLTFI